jgi:hypothetical protein
MLKYAANQIGVEKHRIGFDEGAHWKWSLRPAHQSLVTERPVTRVMADLLAAAPPARLKQGPDMAAGQVDGGRAAEASPDSI